MSPTKRLLCSGNASRIWSLCFGLVMSSKTRNSRGYYLPPLLISLYKFILYNIYIDLMYSPASVSVFLYLLPLSTCLSACIVCLLVLFCIAVLSFFFLLSLPDCLSICLSNKIASFVAKYGLKADGEDRCTVMAKSNVNGAATAPMWRLIKAVFPGDVEWNFAAWVVFDRTGKDTHNAHAYTRNTYANTRARITRIYTHTHTHTHRKGGSALGI